jgi:hypothetical protein
MAATMKRGSREGTIGRFDGIDTIQANRGDTITWDWAAGDRKLEEISIWVPNEEVFGKRLILDNGPLPFQATILDTAPQGTPEVPLVHEYAIYDHTTGRFVEGKSHPKIEIPKP